MEYKEWVKNGCHMERNGSAPHVIKQQIIAQYQQKYKYDILIETGTCTGTMVQAQKSRFKTIISIEIGKKLFQYAKKTFKKYPHIILIHGDSGNVLPDVLKDIYESAIFWLDAHYSGGFTAQGDKQCPIYEELDAIFNSKYNHVLLIDDAKNFNGTNDFPTIPELTAYIKNKNKDYQIEIKYDIIRLCQ